MSIADDVKRLEVNLALAEAKLAKADAVLGIIAEEEIGCPADSEYRCLELWDDCTCHDSLPLSDEDRGRAVVCWKTLLSRRIEEATGPDRPSSPEVARLRLRIMSEDAKKAALASMGEADLLRAERDWLAERLVEQESCPDGEGCCYDDAAARACWLRAAAKATKPEEATE